MERPNAVKFKGNGMTLLGSEVQVGDTAPDFTALNNALEPVSLSDFRGQVVILSCVPSLDTPVCEMQTKRFNDEAAQIDAKIITVSMDLPFAQKRFCSTQNVSNLVVLSDYKDQDFCNKYGLKIKELGLITRAIFVIDKEGKVAYKEICPEVTEHPNYDKALDVARSLA